MRWMMSSMRTGTTSPSQRDVERERGRAAVGEPADALVDEIQVDPIAPRSRQLELELHAGALSWMNVARNERPQDFAEVPFFGRQPTAHHHGASTSRRQRAPDRIADVLDF